MHKKIMARLHLGVASWDELCYPFVTRRWGNAVPSLQNDGMGSKPDSGFAQARQHDPGPIRAVAWCVDQAGEIPGASAPQSQWTDPAAARHPRQPAWF